MEEKHGGKLIEPQIEVFKILDGVVSDKEKVERNETKVRIIFSNCELIQIKLIHNIYYIELEIWLLSTGDLRMFISYVASS